MATNNGDTQQNKQGEQSQRAVKISSGGAANQNTLRNIGLIISREYKNRVTQRSFVISTIIIVLLMAIGAFVPTIIQYFMANSNDQTKVMIVNNAGSIGELESNTLLQYASSVLNGSSDQAKNTNDSAKQPFSITVESTSSTDSLQKEVKDGKLGILLVIQRATSKDLHFTYYNNNSGTTDSNLSKIQVLTQQLNFLDVSHRLGLSSTQASSLFAQPSLDIINSNQSQNNRSEQDTVAGYIIAYVGNILIYISVLIYGMGVAMGVAEEKGSRIMEILVNAATPFQLMVGKIIGIGAAGLTQMACFVAVGIGALLLQTPVQEVLLGSSHIGFTSDMIGSSISLLLLLLVYFILGFALYATLFAAAGAIVRRQDEVQNAIQPITWIFVIGYLVSFLGIPDPNATWVRIISYIPFWTPTTMLTRIGAGGIIWWEVLLTIGIMIVASLVCAIFAARIYRNGILMYGQKPGMKQLINLVRGS
jgi:ABC-2 type transport system permease protein